MRESIRQLWALIRQTDKIWLVPVALFLIIVALLITAATVSPVPIFLYPMV